MNLLNDIFQYQDGFQKMEYYPHYTQKPHQSNPEQCYYYSKQEDIQLINLLQYGVNYPMPDAYFSTSLYRSAYSFKEFIDR